MEASTFPDVWVVEDLQQQKLPARSLVAALMKAGARPRLVDLNQGQAELVAAAQREPPRLILASILFADRVDEHLALMVALRAAGVPARLALTGHLPALAAKTFLNAYPALDFVLCGESEGRAADLAGCLCGMRSWETIPGAVSRRAAATASPPRASSSEVSAWDDGLHSAPDLSGLGDLTGLEQHPQGIRYNLDTLAFPAYDTIPLFRGYGYATIEASRGCYRACAFCLPRAFYARFSVPYRLRSVARLMEEIEKLYGRGARLFLFDDEQFLPPGRARAARIEALAEELARKNLRVAFTIKCRAEDVEPGIFQQLKEMGLVRVYVGIESGCQATLDLLGKQTTVQQNVDALAMLDELSVVADWRALVFHPWSTLEMLEAELAFLHRVSAHLATVVDWREVEVYAGTPLAERLSLEKRGGAEIFQYRWPTSALSALLAGERHLLPLPFREGGRGVRSASGRGDADAWLIPYTIPDPRAELVRRMSSLLFCSDAYRRLCDTVTEVWYEILLARRLGQSQREVEEAELRSLVARANEESLKVWEEMLAFARMGDVYSAEEVNARAGDWAERITLTSYTSPADRSSAPRPHRGDSGTSL